MSDPRYPILVEHLRGPQALLIACQECDWDGTIGPEGIRNERNYACPECGSAADYKYEEADFKCPGCGKLHFDRLPYPDGVCSRVCHLQNEYAKSLSGASA